MYVTESTAPEVVAVARRAFPNYNGRKFEVEVFNGPMRISSCWSGGSRTDYKFVSLDPANPNQHTLRECGNMFSGPAEELRELPENVAMVAHRILCGKDLGITVYVNSINMNKLAIPDKPTLTKYERIVLVYTRAMKPAARFHEAHRDTSILGEEWCEAKESLKNRKLLRKNASITPEGKNAVEGLYPHNRKEWLTNG